MTSNTEPTASRTDSRRVLIVDDDPGDVFLVRQALNASHSSLDLHDVPDGVEALQFLRREGQYAGCETPHLVILDLNMPRMNGLETLEAIRQDERLRSLPVIVLTTSSSRFDIRQAYRHQATCYLNKPLELEALTELLKQLGHFWFDMVCYPD